MYNSLNLCTDVNHVEVYSTQIHESCNMPTLETILDIVNLSNATVNTNNIGF
jgi:hypothetical protein